MNMQDMEKRCGFMISVSHRKIVQIGTVLNWLAKRVNIQNVSLFFVDLEISLHVSVPFLSISLSLWHLVNIFLI